MAYFSKVEETMKNAEAYQQLLQVLQGFEPHLQDVDAGQHVLQLYRQVEDILQPYPDLLEEFVAFLRPQEAAICGKQFQCFLYRSMREFFSKLKVSILES